MKVFYRFIFLDIEQINMRIVFISHIKGEDELDRKWKSSYTF